ncbi:MAG TPA: DUF255 domain-containing protein [Vicinamibacteria bacterium]
MRIRLASAAVLSVALSVPLGAAEPPAAIAWTDWSDAAFARARADGRLVLLDLGAVWCHWCHVMEETTYKDPEVVSLIQTRFVAVRVDQDARPDLSNRYEDYGWPATVVFDSAGQELVKFQGYIEPERMRGLLRAVIADPTPGPSVENATAPSVGEGAALTDAERRDLQAILVNRYDTKHGGWGTSHKYLDWDSVEWCLLRAREGDRNAERMARETLDRQLELIDPVWGGVYQYSDSGDWDHPHFEKIMSMQAEDLRLYAQAHAQLGDARYLQAARDIHKFLTTFLRAPEGAFYVSQDADVVRGEHSGAYFKLGDAERRARGVPRVDTHLYTRETAWAATALLALHAATGEEALLRDAVKSGEWILANRAIEGGGFRHDAVDVAGPYLGDSVAAARLFLALYAATGERPWLERTERTLAFAGARFRREGVAGLVTAAAAGPHDRPALRPPSGPLAAPQRDENIMAARVANLAFHYTANPAHRALADEALRYLARPEVARRFNTGGVLLADWERARDPLHVTVVGARTEPVSRALLDTALREPAPYKRVELWDPAEGPLPHADVSFPPRSRPAAYLCTAGRCSAPADTAEALKAKLRRATLDSARAAR